MSKAIENKLGNLQMYILSILWNQEMYGLEIIKHLKLRRYSVGTNQLYPALKRLEALEALTARKEERVGTTRIYYKITPKGQQLMITQLYELIGLFQDIMLDKIGFLGEYCCDLLQISPGMKILDLSYDFFETFIKSFIQRLHSQGTYYIHVKDVDTQEMYQDRIDFNHFEQLILPILTIAIGSPIL